MNELTRVLVTTGVTAVVTVGLVGSAHALWSMQDTTVDLVFTTGAVHFAAAASDDDSTQEVSEGGAPISVRLPGSTIVEMLDQTGPDPDPVFWRFTASGTGLGITGLNYDVAVGTQVWSDGTAYDASSGIAKHGTVLAGATVKIYPAAAGGDCSTVPATPDVPDGETPRNVHVYSAQDNVLHQPGTNLTGGTIEQEWCVALSWNNSPDGHYANNVQASGTAEDGTAQGAVAQWRAAVAFPPSLDVLGSYLGRAFAVGVAEDETLSRDEDDWGADLYPDPSGEPDLTITLDPTITNLNPAVETGDTFTLTTPIP